MTHRESAGNRGSRRRPRSAKDRQGYIILGAIVAAAVAILSMTAYLKHSRPVYGPDQCEVESATNPRRKPVPQTVVLLDQSERLSESQRGFVQQTLEELIAQMGRGERLLFFTFSRDEFQSLKARLALCKPQDSANPLYETEIKIRSHLRTKFIKPVLEMGAATSAEEVGTSSPILEALHALSHSGDLEVWDTPYRMILISDLLQHSATYSQYRGPPDYPAWKRRDGGNLAAAFANWNLDVIYLERMKDASLQGNPHREFWQQYFYDAGAHIKTWRPVP